MKYKSLSLEIISIGSNFPVPRREVRDSASLWICCNNYYDFDHLYDVQFAKLNIHLARCGCSQIQAYVFDVIRSTVPRMELDQAFESKDDIAQAVLEQLQNVMKDYGYAIVNTLVTDLAPDVKVKASMNEINAARRLKEAASHQAEADKVRQVKVRLC